MVNFFRRTWLYFLVAALPFERIPSWDVNVFGHSITLRLSLLIAALALACFIWRIRPSWSFRKPTFWIGLYLVVAGIASIFGLNHGRSLVAYAATLLVVLTAILISEYASLFSLKTLFRVMTIVSVATCLFGIYQFIGDTAGLPTYATGLKEMYTKEVFGFPRIQSTGLEPLYFANYLLIPLALTFSLLYAGRLKGKKWYAVLFLYAITMALTLSRGGFAGTILAVGLCAVLLYRRSILRRAGLIFGTVIVAVICALSSIAISGQLGGGANNQGGAVSNYVKQSTHLTSGAGSADNDRVTNRRLAIAAFVSHPILGVGLGDFGTYAKDNEMNYRLTNGEVIVNNEYLEVAAETGILGLLTLVIFFVLLAWSAYQAGIYAPVDLEGVWRAALLAILVGFAVQYYAFSTLYIMHIWVTIGLLMSLSRPKHSA